MTITYNLYVFNRHGTCLHYAEWQRPKSVTQARATLLSHGCCTLSLAVVSSHFREAATAVLDECRARKCTRFGGSSLFHHLRTAPII